MTKMKTTAVLCAVATAAASFSGAAFAQGRDYDGERFDRRGDRQERREERRDRRTDRQWDRGQVVRAQPLAPAPAPHARASHWNGNPTYSAPRYSYHSNYSSYPRYSYNYQYVHPRTQYYVGGYVPTSYRQPYYYVSDWNRYHLHAPPYGHQWVRTDTGDFLLMALATGLIANLILNHR